MVRRAAALGIGLLVVVLLVLGINGCLSSRKEQALKDYNRNVSSLVQEANSNSDAFFQTLTNGGTSSTGIQSDLNQLRFRAQAQTKQATQMDVPGEMKVAHRNFVLSLSLLQEAMGRVAEKIPSALSKEAATAEAGVRGIAGEMRAFDASDVVYNRRTSPLIKEVLDKLEIGGQVIANSNFLQNLGWLQPSTVAKRINAEAGTGAGDGGTTEPAPGLHGHGLLAVSVGDTTLTAGGANRLRASSNVTFNVKFANQGDNPENDVKVRVRITGGGKPITVQKVVDQTMSKSEVTVAVPLGQAPPINTAVTIKVEIVPVPGEKNTTNNVATYPALFSRT